MSSSNILSSSVQNQHQHPFLFQQHQYSSGDDGDSPPSLTNSSESPRSISEEGDTSVGQFDLFDASQQKRISQSGSAVKKGRFEATRLTVEGEDSIMSPVQAAASPNWESVFAATIGSDEMDMSTPVTANDPKPMLAKSTATLTKALNAPPTMANRDAVDARTGSSSATNDYDVTAVRTAENDSSILNDEAMFESLIQEDSFDNSASSPLPTGATCEQEATKQMSAQAMSNLDSAKAASSSQSAPVSSSPPSAALTSTSALSSRRNSNENDQGKKGARAPHSGSHYSHTSDTDLPTSSQVVVRPPRAELNGLQVHVHGIAFTGAKSRVETQIRTRIELVRPVASAAGSTSQFERVGSFNHVKLPPLTGTKRRSKKHKPNDIAAETTLFMDATVVRATPPHERVLVCSSCQQRERKRAQRKRTSSSGNKGVTEKIIEEEGFSVEELQDYGIDPSAADAQEQARQRASLEDEKRVVVFNCGDFINFEDGACVLPTRITCYCRHHKEKTGFCLIFTMRDYRGNLVATGSTPPIMITDDHKSVAAAQAAAATSSTSTSHKRNTRSRGTSTDNLEEGPNLRSIGKDSFKKKRSHRAKPYADAEDRATSRRSTISSNVMTPFTSTGQNTPAACNSPPSQQDMNHPDFWNAFAAMTTLAQSPQGGISNASHGARTPHDALSPMSQQRSPIQTQAHLGGQEWLGSVGNQGSISSQTLNLCPQSLPGFDMDAFTRSLQQSSQQDEATMQHLYMLARSLPGVDNTSSHNNLIQSNINNDSSLPIPLISKLIPGEGPTIGGIEVTVLGENFTDGLTCLFGDVPATSTKVWGSNTLLCILPPSASPGPVAVSIKRPGDNSHISNGQDRYGRSLQLFTYVDTTDRALMELALQVVGLQMTGQMQTARDVAMRVVGSGSNGNLARAQGGSTRGNGSGQYQMRNAVPGMFAGGQSNQSFQDSVLQFLTTLDEPVGSQRREAIRLANKQGHTLLHLTVILGFHRLALSLIQRGCPINARDHNGYTALHFAALHGRMTIARLLLTHGARWDVECEAGRFPIDVAREREQVDVELLLEERMEDAFSNDENDDTSDWTTDEEEVDADNISTQAEESVELSHTSDELEQVQGKKESTKREVISPTATGQSTPKADEKSRLSKTLSEKTTQDESEKKAMEARSGLKGLVSGGIDFAQKWPIGMPTVLHDRFNLMHMPTVSVFQMVLPPNFMSWAGQTEGTSSTTPSSNEKEKATEEGESRQTSEERFKALTMWRNIIEESAMWINPLYSPPPTYESALHTKKGIAAAAADDDDQFVDIRGRESGDSSKRATSRFPAIAPASPDSPHKTREMETRRDLDRPDFIEESSRSASWPANQASSSSSNRSSRRNGKSASTSSLLESPSATSITSRPPRQLKEDRMLVYFWLPALIFVILVLSFAKPSSVLSYKDLVSFMPVR